MIALLDVNVLIALFDPMHGHHEAAHQWLGENREAGWATCPLTENGFVRVLSNPAYPGRRTTPLDALGRLADFRNSGDHFFWSDDVSLCDTSIFEPRHIGGYRQLTDVYLLGLAARHEGRLVTFDRGIHRLAVQGAKGEHLEVIGT